MAINKIVSVLVLANAVVVGVGDAAGASLMISARDVASAPLVIGKAKVEADKQGAFLCGGVPRGSGLLAFVPLKIEGATELVVTPCIEVTNPFGDRADWVGVDLSFDGVTYKPLAAVKGHRGKKREFVKFCEALTIPCKGKVRAFVRIRLSAWWYPKFPRFRWLKLDAKPESARVVIDKNWTRGDFLAAFRRARPTRRAKPAPHVIYLCGPVSGILLWERFMRQEPVDAIVGLAGVSLNGWTAAEVVGLAEVLEAMGIPFMLRAGAPNAIAISPEVADKAFDVAPTMCRGVFAGEVWNCGAAYKQLDHFVRILDVAHRRGKKFAWFEHGRDGAHGLGFWGWCMDQPQMFSKVFDKRFHDTLIPMHENNDPRSQMANLGIVLGAWLQGLGDEWGASVQTWWWNDAGYGRCPTCPPELITRMMALYLALGATWFEIEGPEMFLAWDERGLPIRSPQWPGLSKAYELLTNGWLRIPSKDEVASIPRVGFVLRKGKSGLSIFDPHPWRPRVPSTYIPSKLYGVSNYGDELFPLTSCGFVPLFSPHTPLPAGFFSIETDGRRLWAEGAEVDISRAAAIVEEKATKLPVVSPDACAAVWREGKGLKILLLHPQERAPASVKARLEIRADFRMLRDVQTGENFKVLGGVANVPLSPERRIRILATKHQP